MANGPAHLICLADLFEGRRFVIPDYQRGYSWEARQLTDLRKDIENLYGRPPEQKHYTGTIVASDRTADHAELDIVDGQQRLTSLVILIKAIHDTDPEHFAHLRELYIERGGVGNQTPVLRPNEETRLYFQDRILRNNANAPRTVKSHENLHAAAKFFGEWLNEAPDKVEEILEIVTKRFGFIFFMPQHDKEIGIMFEVINNRGKALSQLEKMKNYFIYYATVKDRASLHDAIDLRWHDLQRHLSLANLTSNAAEDRFLRYCYLVFFETNKERSWDVYAQMKEHFPVSGPDGAQVDQAVATISHFVDFVERASRYAGFLYRDKEYLKLQHSDEVVARIDRTLRYLRCHPVDASIMPLYFAIMDRTADPADQDRLLRTLEVLNFRLYVLPRVLPRADSKQGELFQLAYAYFHRKGEELHNEEWLPLRPGVDRPTGTAAERLEVYLRDAVARYCPENKFVEALTMDRDENENYYRWNGIRFFLASYEEHLNKAKGLSYDIQEILKNRSSFGTEANDRLSVEHIWAQNHLGDRFPPDEREKRRLGNLVLLGISINSSLSDDGIHEKVAEIRDRDSKNSGAMKLLQVEEMAHLLGEATTYIEETLGRKHRTSHYYLDLATRINDLRETEMIRFALQRWKLEGEQLDRFVEVDSKAQEKENQVFIMKPEVKEPITEEVPSDQ